MKHYFISCILFFLSPICSAQTEKLFIEKVSTFSLQKINTDTLTHQNTEYQLVIVSDISTYYPTKDTIAYIECRFVNKSDKSVLIDTSVFRKFILLTCNHRWPLYMREFEVNAIKDTPCTLKPKEEIVVFRSTLKKLCFSDKYRWDWAGHPAPPRSPIHESFLEKGEYLDETCLFFAYNINGIIVLSNILKLKIT